MRKKLTNPKPNTITSPGTHLHLVPPPAPPPKPTNPQVFPREQIVHGPLPSAPTGLTARVLSSTQVQLSWSLHDNNATRIFVERSTSPFVNQFNAIATLSVPSTSYTDTVSGGVTYYYAIGTENIAGVTNSTTVSVTTPVVGNTTPVMWLKANGSIGEANGSVTTTAVGAETYTSDAMVGQSFDFSGGQWFVSISDQAPLDLSSFTVSLWRKRFNPARVHDINGIGELFAWGGGGFNMYEIDAVTGTDGAVRFGLSAGRGPGTDYGQSSLTLPTSVWAHVAVAMDVPSGMAWVWINGQPDPSNPYTIPTTALSFAGGVGIPCLDDLSTYGLLGYIDDVRMFSGVLSDSDVATIYAQSGA